MLRVPGKVAADETRVFRVNVGTDGYIKSTQDDAIGNRVKKDQRLAVIHSPEFLTLRSGYFSASGRTLASPKNDAVVAQNSASVQARADRLRNRGMSDAQIEELGGARTIPQGCFHRVASERLYFVAEHFRRAEVREVHRVQSHC